MPLCQGGDGYLLELLVANGPHIGIDRSAAELGLARRRLGEAAPLVRSDATGPPIATGSMGGARCHYALMLLQPLEAVLESSPGCSARAGSSQP
jgi:hypothetical protein